MPAVLRTPVLFLVLLAISCGSGRSSDTAPSPDTSDQPRARIENRSSLDMDIYVVRNERERIRLGFVPGNENAAFALPPRVTAGATSIRFEARPVRRAGEPVVSELFGVTGEEIVWSIPPQ